MFLLGEVIADVLNNPDTAPLIKTLSLAFVLIPHGQQFRALMQKDMAFNKIGMIETSAVLAGFTVTVIGAHFWPLAMTAILGYLVNCALRTLLFGYFGRQIYRPGLHFSLASVTSNLRFGAADGGQHHQLYQHQSFHAGAGPNAGRRRGGRI